jgi:hypothetical protein
MKVDKLADNLAGNSRANLLNSRKGVSALFSTGISLLVTGPPKPAGD